MAEPAYGWKLFFRGPSTAYFQRGMAQCWGLNVAWYVEVHSGRWIITYCLLVRPNKELYTLPSFSLRLNLFRFLYMTVTRLNMTCSMGPILHMALPILGINIQHKEREEDPTCIIGTTFLPFSYDMFFFGGTARGYSSKL